MPHLTVHWRDDLPLGLRSANNGRDLVMSRSLLQRERRSSCTHELIHIERGEFGHCNHRDEEQVRQETAHRLITLDALAAALAWTRDVGELAEELWCDEITVRTRLEHLHPSERHYLKRRLEHTEESA